MISADGCERGVHGMRIGRLRVVDVLHAVRGQEAFQPVRAGFELGEGVRDGRQERRILSFDRGQKRKCRQRIFKIVYAFQREVCSRDDGASPEGQDAVFYREVRGKTSFLVVRV